MMDSEQARRIAQGIVASADNVAYLIDGLGRKPLPAPWPYGPALEVRLRFDRPFSAIDDAELARRLDSLQISGPLRVDRLVAIAERLCLQPGDLLPIECWSPRGFGLWRVDGAPAMGIKVYVSSRPSVDLLLAIPPGFLKAFSGGHGFRSWRRIDDLPGDFDGLVRLCIAIRATLRRAQPVSRLEAVHLQDQAWCVSMRPTDRGLVLPRRLIERCGWQPMASSVRDDDWAAVSLD